jgi:hypothetical protein
LGVANTRPGPPSKLLGRPALGGGASWCVALTSFTRAVIDREAMIDGVTERAFPAFL